MLVNARAVKNMPGRKTDLLTELPQAILGRVRAGRGWAG